MFGMGASSSFSSGNWICMAGDGTNKSGTSLGVAITAGHYYDLIVDVSIAGKVTCSVSDNGGAFVSVTHNTNVPSSSSTGLGLLLSTTALSASFRSIAISYVYMESN
jgi:hypothetical protein